MENRKKANQNSDWAGAANASSNISATQTNFDKFRASQGHGFAAEQANNLYDILTGKKATVVGGNNAKDGADRLVNGVYIQTKYCKTASGSIGAAFEQGQYRYINADGSLMQIEVPYDQYSDAVKLMKNRIKNGQVPGVTNPDDAKSLVRQGHFTYEQAKNIAKFGTLESVTFDATNGAVVGTSAFGISAIMTYALSLWSGDTPDIAFENAMCSGIKMGGIAFLNTVITSQLMRTELNTAMTGVTDGIARHLGKDTSAKIANALIEGANISGEMAVSNVSKLLRGTLVSNAVMVVLLSTKDISNAFRGRISGKQLFKNVTTTAAGVTGGTVAMLGGQLLLNVIAPGAGTVASIAVSVISGAVGGTVAGSATNKLIGHFVEDDAVELVNILERHFITLSEDYLLSAEELDICLVDLQNKLTNEIVMDMYACKDRDKYAVDFIRPIIERLIAMRCRIALFFKDNFFNNFDRLIYNADNKIGIFSQSAMIDVDPVEIGKMVTGQEFGVQASKKAWYATKQSNMVQTQTELQLQRVLESNVETTKSKQNIDSKRTQMKESLDTILEEF